MVFVVCQCRLDEALTQRFKEYPILPFIGISQGAAGSALAQPAVIWARVLRVQTSHQIAQTLASGELGIRHAYKVTPSAQAWAVVIG